MFLKDEQWYMDLKNAKIARNLSDPEEDEAYARLVMRGEVKRYG